MHWYVTLINGILGTGVLYLAIRRLRARAKNLPTRLSNDPTNDD